MKDYFAQNRNVLEAEYRKDCPFGGLSLDELKKGAEEIISSGRAVPDVKAALIAYLLRNAPTDVNPKGLFADKLCHGGISEQFKLSNLANVRATSMSNVLDSVRAFQETKSFTGDVDFGHTCPDWENILALGLTGILAEINAYLSNMEVSDEKYAFYSRSKTVYEAAIDYVARLAAETERLASVGDEDSENLNILASSLRALTVRAPETLHEAMELIFIWYFLQQQFDSVYIRSIGQLDIILYPYYEHDIKNGALTEKDVRTLLKYFLSKMGSKKVIANIPFSLSGRNVNGNDMTNELTYLILDEYIALDIEDPKIHIRCHKGTPNDLVMTVLRSIREGKNSFVFMDDSVVENSLLKLGVAPEDACRYSVVGCYEPSAYGEIPCTCAGRINLSQAVLLTLNDGIDPLSGTRVLPSEGTEICSFDDFLERFYRIVDCFSEGCMKLVSEYERRYMDICPSPLFSAALPSSLANGKDIYAGGAKYNNTSVCAFGIATAVDSLAAIRRAVFEERRFSLGEFAEILKADWSGHEELREEIVNTYPKYGNDDEATDELMIGITDRLAKKVNGYENGRGGVFRLGLFSIDWRFEIGEHTGATPDGRRAGETVSKNMSAVMGCDRNGVTSLIRSVTKLDYTDIPNGTVLDVLLHASSVSGDDGLAALYGLLAVYQKRGGMAIQFNILDPKVLRAAQADPVRYKTLQVRLCGWNVHFVNLTKTEQDEFIRQAEHMGAAS